MQPLKTTLVVVLSALLSTSALAENPYGEPDDSWISISGTALSPANEQFMLDYGDGVITVEVDDFDSYDETKALMDGDKVTVYGKIDDDLYEIAKIEASAVYVDGLNTYFYASAVDEEDLAHWAPVTPVVLGHTKLRGTVTNVDKVGKDFTVDTGIRKVTVQPEFVGYNPLDEHGYQKIEVGDTVSVSGAMDNDFLEGRVLEADTVITLSEADDRAPKKKKKKR